MIEQIKLPYALDALEPYISARTMDYHYGKHYAGYVKKVNELTAGTIFDSEPLTEIILKTVGLPEHTALYNNAAQAWNHAFFWNSLTADVDKRVPSESLMRQIVHDFGSYDGFKELFKKTALAQFGSGWTWLIQQEGALKIVSTSNAGTPIVYQGQNALLCVDVWEHAYYLDYQNKRDEFVQTVLDYLLNWDFANQNFFG